MNLSRDKHPRVWAVAIWLAVSVVPILIGWTSGKLHLPQFVFWTLLIIWAVPWIVVSTGLWMVFTPVDRREGKVAPAVPLVRQLGKV